MNISPNSRDPPSTLSGKLALVFFFIEKGWEFEDLDELAKKTMKEWFSNSLIWLPEKHLSTVKTFLQQSDVDFKSTEMRELCWSVLEDELKCRKNKQE